MAEAEYEKFRAVQDKEFESDFDKEVKKMIEREKPVNVIVTFWEEVKTPDVRKLDINEFFFKNAKKQFEGYKESLSDTIIEEGRSAV